ncbi:hypothetical protein AXG93_2712s1050 [Marchantia polymorpha subsp. ruderalis]|uniref:Uncharacterized protein n=1 Tax=Marchantia polymorpha subsp. ruderalis TaxID=1480154 RepID=A0A176VNG5_MARPO|nr:hypothetical protein AXG93_2712s1050 [Marchantia polymorpha subsp. ruderalis]
MPADSSADTGRAAVARNSPTSEEDVSAEVLGSSIDLPAPKAQVPSEEARRPSSHRGRHAATARMPAMEREEPSAQATSAQEPSTEAPLVLKPLELITTGEGKDAETRVPSALASSAVLVREGVAGPPGAGSPTPLEVLARHGVEATAEEAVRPSARESTRIFAATKILETEDDTPSEEE